ncbi:DNA mismatch repair protein msh6 [Podochytrium sp. JEL0797]|nr:DNA mismatch repair protein msh6 [Podochytrium sp. JEL0797]
MDQKMLGKNKKTPSKQRTITSFFGTPKPAASASAPASQASPSVASAAAPVASPQVHAAAVSEQSQNKDCDTKMADAQRDEDDDDDEEAVVAPVAKRRTQIIDDSSDDDSAPIAKRSKVSVPKTPQKAPALAHFASASKTPTTPAKQMAPQSYTTPSKSTPFSSDRKKDRADEFKKRNESRYAWLQDERDAEKRRPGEEGYDPRTLYIPDSAWNKFTAFETQFWTIKSKHWDTIVFFKKGKFFELYEKDADVAHREFDWKVTDRTNMKMCGAPEMSFDTWASQFVARGYKVAKVDQIENALSKDMNDKKSGTPKKDSIIRRELTMVLTAGTLVDTQLLMSDMSTYCMAIKEEVRMGEEGPRFGVAFVDTSTAEFSVSHFGDDVHRTHLETLLRQLKPKELVLEKGGVSATTFKLIKNCLPESPQINHLVPDAEFWSAEATWDELQRVAYFGVPDLAGKICVSMPEAVEKVKDVPVVLSALGGLLSYLRSLKLDKDLVSARNFHTYDPLRQFGNLVLDGQTLLNLEVFENTSDGGTEGTLFKLLNHCVSPSGKRLFKTWVCHPLQDIDAINERLDAVDDLFECIDARDQVVACLRVLPDLERIISRIHAGTARVKDFMLALKGFKDIFNLMSTLEPSTQTLRSTRLRLLLTTTTSPTLLESLDFFENAFDHSAGLATTEIVANRGYDDVFDAADAHLDCLAEEFEAVRKGYERSMGCKLAYRDLGKDLFQVEVKVGEGRKVPAGWVVQSKTQAVTRYYTPETKRILDRYLIAREERDQALKHVRTRMFAKFDTHYSSWLTVTKRVAELDCLLSLALCRSAMQGPLCRPQFVPAVDGCDSVLDVTELRHPCILVDKGKDVIPNDLLLGGDTGGAANMVLLTGPNMGGKSTLLRQTCLAVMMAQMGCYVPAQTCRLTPFSRIFTRIGAHDNILAGQSTFMVELSETSKILREATPRSLVILDELGRGTSTFDGYAIAFGVLYELVTRTRCLGLFSTHYGMLTREFEGCGGVGLRYMSFVADEEKHQITFLYKLAEGVCPKSFGMNVAVMAGVPASIVDTAERVASGFERKLKMGRDNVSGLKMSRQADFANLWNGRATRAIFKSLG